MKSSWISEGIGQQNRPLVYVDRLWLFLFNLTGLFLMSNTKKKKKKLLASQTQPPILLKYVFEYYFLLIIAEATESANIWVEWP